MTTSKTSHDVYYYIGSITNYFLYKLNEPAHHGASNWLQNHKSTGACLSCATATRPREAPLPVHPHVTLQALQVHEQPSMFPGPHTLVSSQRNLLAVAMSAACMGLLLTMLLRQGAWL